MATPFTQWECEMAVWLADARGWPTATPGWIGSCVASMDGEQGFEEEAAQESGVPYAGVKLLHEQHTLTIENLWTFDDGGRMTMPGMRRDQRFVAVLIWTDETTGRWVRRQYYHCTFNPFRFSSKSQHFEGKVDMKAGYMEESHGMLDEEIPSLAGVAAGSVRYVSSTENLALYAYPAAGGAFTAIANTAGRAAIAAENDGTHVFRMTFDGVKALGILPDGTVQCGHLEANGVTAPGSLPALEFYMGPSRYGSVTADGGVHVPSFTLQAVNPALTEDFELRDGGGAWLASLARTGLFAPAVDDTLL